MPEQDKKNDWLEKMQSAIKGISSVADDLSFLQSSADDVGLCKIADDCCLFTTRLDECTSMLNAAIEKCLKEQISKSSEITINMVEAALAGINLQKEVQNAKD